MRNLKKIILISSVIFVNVVEYVVHNTDKYYPRRHNRLHLNAAQCFTYDRRTIIYRNNYVD